MSFLCLCLKFSYKYNCLFPLATTLNITHNDKQIGQRQQSKTTEKSKFPVTISVVKIKKPLRLKPLIFLYSGETTPTNKIKEGEKKDLHLVVQVVQNIELNF